jgi:tetratricopeptide (TPR) repeat protein
MVPSSVLADAEFFFHFLRSPERPIGKFDERDFFLGEMALLAGAAARFLAFRENAGDWLDRAETYFVLVHSSGSHVARVAYQRLALRLEERQFDAVLELAPRWVEAFSKLGLPGEALKCRFLEAISYKELQRMEDAKAAFHSIRSEASRLKNDRLSAIASENVFQIHAFLGETEEALSEARNALAALKRLDNRVGLAKLQLGVGYLLRSSGRLQQSIGAFRAAQREFGEIGMHADVAAIHLVLADLLLDASQPAQAEWEIRAALPVIDELKLVPEGIAALSLLRDSIRRRQIDRQALRSLNGYFEELKS